MQLEELRAIARGAAAVRRVRRLLPAGGPGDKVFPPTYPGPNDAPTHVFEERRIGEDTKTCVLLDSVQSQANRMELALRDLLRSGGVRIPHVLVDFEGTKEGEEDLSDLGRITSLEAPHRVFDAIFRDSELDGTWFWDSPPGLELIRAKPERATAVFELSPTALVFGCWRSTGRGGGLGAKFPRAIVSEIVGVDAVSGKRTGSRIDPLEIRREVEIYKGSAGWALSREEAGERAKRVRPSEINHGNIAPTILDLGVTIDHALQTAVISLPTLRRLRFPVNGEADEGRDEAARTVLAALALLAVVAQDRAGYNLRSRCDLVPDGAASFEILDADGGVTEFALDLEGACALYGDAVKAAEDAGLPWREKPLRLEPQERLVRLVAESRRLALAGKTEGAEG